MKKYIIRIWNSVKIVHYSRVMLKKGYTKVQEDRLDICYVCPFNSDNKKDKSFKNKVFIKLNMLVNNLYGIKVTTEATCTVCDCNLSVLSSINSSKYECKKGKWK